MKIKKKEKKKDSDRITIRLDAHVKLKLDELTEKLDTNYSILVRTMLEDWIIKNETVINNIIDKKNNPE